MVSMTEPLMMRLLLSDIDQDRCFVLHSIPVLVGWQFSHRATEGVWSPGVTTHKCTNQDIMAAMGLVCGKVKLAGQWMVWPCHAQT